jgi:uncharacterized damage-inducible protein DinB
MSRDARVTLLGENMADGLAGDLVRADDPIALLCADLDTELATTRKMLALVPMERADWKPHEKSMTLGALSIHLAQLPAFGSGMCATDVLVFDPVQWKPPVVTSATGLLELFDEKSASLKAMLSQQSWQTLRGTWSMEMGGARMLHGERAFMLRHMCINHLVHHRAQLGVYLRLLDVEIPGSYGPSADTMPKR